MVRTECGPLAQLAEQQTLNLRVLGSIPRRLTTTESTTYSLRSSARFTNLRIWPEIVGGCSVNAPHSHGSSCLIDGF